jgi:hypothetical protein
MDVRQHGIQHIYDLNVFTAKTSLLGNQETGITLYVQQMIEALGGGLGHLTTSIRKGCRNQIN